MSRRKVCILIGFVAVLGAAWLFFNPPGRFGWCRFAVTTYGCVPRVVSDLQVAADGKVRKVAKTHELGYEKIEWLLEGKPEVLIIGIGWDGAVRIDEKIRSLSGIQLELLKSGEAIQLFNRLKKSGKKAAIHLHSTC